MRLSSLFERIDIEKTVQNYGEKLQLKVQQDRGGGDLSAATLIKFIMQNDPSPNKKFTLWLIRTYINDGINYLEDFSRAGQALKLFVNHQRQLEVKDINQYKTLTALEDAVEPFEQAEQEKSARQMKALEKQKIQSETKIVYEGPDGTILIPLSQEASCFWGRGTRWCTAATRADNPFHSHGYDDGNLFIVIHGDRKVQIHPPSGQIMNEKDVPVTPTDRAAMKMVKWFFGKLPRYRLQIVAVDGRNLIFLKNPSEEEQIVAVRQREMVRKRSNPNEVMPLIKNPSPLVRSAANGTIEYWNWLKNVDVLPYDGIISHAQTFLFNALRRGKISSLGSS